MKSIFKSKTFWFAVVTFILGGLQAMQTLNLDQSLMGYITMAIGFVSFVLRLLTTTAIA